MKETTIEDLKFDENVEGAKEIVPGMTVEEMKAVYFNADALKEPPYRIYQLNTDGHRYYYRFVNGEPVFYPSVTTILKQVMPTSPFLIQWMLANGAEGATEKRDLAAAYGTFMHIQFEQLIINRNYDFDKVPEVLKTYLESENLPDKVFWDWADKIRKDVLAFAQFVKDWNVKPLAIEIGLVHPQYHYAGCVDMPCVLTDPKKGDTFRAIVDFKSGRKGFWEEHELQLHLYKDMWNVNFPDTPIERVFNFSPKDWRKDKPTYNFKEQTDSENAAKIPHLLALAAIEDEKRDNTLTVVSGVLNLDEGRIADNVQMLSLSELIKSKAAEEPEPQPSEEMPENRTATPQNDAKGSEAINHTTKAKKSLKTEKSEKLLNEEIEF